VGVVEERLVLRALVAGQRVVLEPLQEEEELNLQVALEAMVAIRDLNYKVDLRVGSAVQVMAAAVAAITVVALDLLEVVAHHMRVLEPL
jgi:predicted transcriptional regulator